MTSALNNRERKILGEFGSYNDDGDAVDRNYFPLAKVTVWRHRVDIPLNR